MKKVTAIRVVSDYDYSNPRGVFHGLRGPIASYLVVPLVLSVSDSKVSGMLLPDSKKGRREIPVFNIEVCLGSELTSKTITLSFSTKARAEVCRDDILEAIDEYWMGRALALYEECTRARKHLPRAQKYPQHREKPSIDLEGRGQ